MADRRRAHGSSVRTVLTAVLVAAAVPLFTPGTAAAEFKTADASAPVDEFRQLEVHSTADCRRAEGQCHFTASTNIRTPDGVEGFPQDLWGKQTTELRSSDRLSYLWTQWDAPNTQERNSGSTWELTTIYNGGGPGPFQITGTTQPTNWGTGQPKLDSDYIVCTRIEANFQGRYVISPDACSQVRFS